MPLAKRKKKGPPAKPRPSVRLHLALAACAIAALVLLVYYNSITNSFVWDDHEQIVMNPAIRPAAPLTRIFSSDVRFAHQDPAVQNQTYRPLQMLTYRIVGASFGFTPAPFHLTNLLLAIACVLAAFAVFWLLTQSTFSAFAAASLFAVYPIHTEAVDWIAASPDLGCTLFLLIALALFLAARRTERPHRPPWLFPLLSLAAFAISLLWKETSAVFPILLVAYVLIVERTGLRTALKASAAYWAILALYLIVRFSVLGRVATGARDWALDPLQLLLTTSHLMLSYWLKLTWPFQLNAYYVFSPVRSLTDPRAIAAIVFVLAAIAGLIYLVRRAPLPAFAALWVGITLLPAMDIYAVGRNVFAERYLYLPSIGFCLLLVLAATRLILSHPENFANPQLSRFSSSQSPPFRSQPSSATPTGRTTRRSSPRPSASRPTLHLSAPWSRPPRATSPPAPQMRSKTTCKRSLSPNRRLRKTGSISSRPTKVSPRSMPTGPTTRGPSRCSPAPGRSLPRTRNRQRRRTRPRPRRPLERSRTPAQQNDCSQPGERERLIDPGPSGLAIPPRPNQGGGMVLQSSGSAPGAGRLQRISA